MRNRTMEWPRVRKANGWRRLTLGLLLVAIGASAVGAQKPGQMPGMGTHLDDMKWGNTLFVLLDELEIAPGRVGRPVSLDARAWYGGAVHRINVVGTEVGLAAGGTPL